MTKYLFIASFLLLGIAAHAEHTRVTNPNAISVEALGRGLLYSVQFDRVLSDDLVAGLGFGTVSLKRGDLDTGTNTSLFPFYVNYYVTRDQGSIYGTAGVTLVSDSSAANGLESSAGNLKFSSSPLVPMIGIGYENRSDAGFMFRATAYGMVGKSFAPWMGISFGYSF